MEDKLTLKFLSDLFSSGQEKEIIKNILAGETEQAILEKLLGKKRSKEGKND